MAATFNRSHYVLRIKGHFGPNSTTARDFWSTGFRIGLIGDDVPLGGDLTSFLESISARVATFHATAQCYVGSNVWLTELTVARVGHDGKYEPAAQETTRRAYSSPVQGAAQPVHPWNTAMVISLRTGYPRGIASNGRTYYPAVAMPLDTSTGRITAGNVSTYVAHAKALCDDINDAAGDDLGPLNRIGVFGQNGKTGSARTGWVERIRCDDRLDSIERRENDQVSLYQETALA